MCIRLRGRRAGLLLSCSADLEKHGKERRTILVGPGEREPSERLARLIKALTIK